ncbi:hypothetical protein WR25_05415 [Diploscapter pachys]|uniref:Uncharacterized protein n=1 Tax=Diploscapter pachys TaxID=2018661 RepID=A0A2A2K9Y7_9BILA|nr:hypothetical protein WR25_05415 [Diploscapter pachys]
MNLGPRNDSSDDLGDSASVAAGQQKRASSRHLMFDELRPNDLIRGEIEMHRISSESDIVSLDKGRQLSAEKLKSSMNGILREAEEAWGRIESAKKTGHRQLDVWTADIETTTSRLRGVGSEELLNYISIEIGKRQFAESEIERLKKQNLDLSSRLHMAEVEVYNAQKNVIAKTRSKFESAIEEMISNEKRLVDRVESLKMLKPQNETLMQQLANVQKKCQGLEHELQEANKKIGNLQYQTDSQNRKIESLDAEKVKLHDVVRAQKEENDDLRQNVKYLETETQTLQNHYEDLKRQYDGQEEKYKKKAELHERELEKKMTKYKDELCEKLQSTLEEKTRKYEVGNEDLQRKLRISEEAYGNLNADLEKEMKKRKEAEAKMHQYEANFEQIRLRIIEDVRREVAKNYRGMVEKIGQSSVSTSRGENADAIKALISTMELEKENRHRSEDLC